MLVMRTRARRDGYRWALYAKGYLSVPENMRYKVDTDFNKRPLEKRDYIEIGKQGEK